jgi:DNA-binding CsgD family transcriptional regulator
MNPPLMNRRASDREYRLFGQMFDELDHGVMLFAASGELHYANLWAREVLNRGASFVLSEGKISATPGFRLLWESGVSAASSGERRMLFHGRGESAMSVALMPLDSYWRETPKGLVLAIFGKRQMCESLTLIAYGRANRLTAAEQAVLERLCHGDAPALLAERLSVAESTVRSHIKSILAKTGTPSIRELLIVLTKLPPMQPRIKPPYAQHDANQVQGL